MLVIRMLTVSALSLAVACGRRPTSESDATAAAASTQLTSTYWKLVAIGDRPVSIANSQREPHIVLQPDSKRVNGSGGCNSMFGTYELNGDALTFTGIGATKMACQAGMDTENEFLPLLERVASWRITGPQLELRDRGGAVIAKFEAKK